MACSQLTKLYQLCQTQQILLSTTDLVRAFCNECRSSEVCPTSFDAERLEWSDRNNECCESLASN